MTVNAPMSALPGAVDHGGSENLIEVFREVCEKELQKFSSRLTREIGGGLRQEVRAEIASCLSSASPSAPVEADRFERIRLSTMSYYNSSNGHDDAPESPTAFDPDKPNGDAATLRETAEGESGEFRKEAKKKMTAYGPAKVLQDFVPTAMQEKLGLTSADPSEEELMKNAGPFLQVLLKIQKFVKGEIFDSAMCSIVVVNAIVIGVQAEVVASQPVDQGTPAAFETFEQLFFVIFLGELILRLSCFQWGFFTDEGWQWNMFDVVIIGLQLFEQFMNAISGPESSEVNSESSNFMMIRILKILRLIRILRVMRVVRFLGDLKKMVYLIAASMHSFVWTVAILLLMAYVLGVFLTQLVTDHRIMAYHSLPDDTDGTNATAQQSPTSELEMYRLYGSLSGSMMSLFQAISGGCDWRDIMDPLADNISPMMGLVFTCYIAFAVLVVLNLVTGVFVEGAQRCLRMDKESEQIKALSKLFTRTELDGDGQMQYHTFQEELNNPQLVEFFSALDFTMREARVFFDLLDRDRNGHLSLEEFVLGSQRLCGPARNFDLAMLALEHGVLCDKLDKFCEQVKTNLSSLDRRSRAIQSHLARHGRPIHVHHVAEEKSTGTPSKVDDSYEV